MEEKLVPTAEEDDLTRRLKILFSSMKILSAQESERRSEELARMREEIGDAAMNEFLFEQFGLE